MKKLLEATVASYGTGIHQRPEYKIYLSIDHIIAVFPNFRLQYENGKPLETAIQGSSIELAARDEEGVVTWNVMEDVQSVLKAIQYLTGEDQ